jgi:hypothetical protein
VSCPLAWPFLWARHSRGNEAHPDVSALLLNAAPVILEQLPGRDINPCVAQQNRQFRCRKDLVRRTNAIADDQRDGADRIARENPGESSPDDKAVLPEGMKSVERLCPRKQIRKALVDQRDALQHLRQDLAAGQLSVLL